MGSSIPKQFLELNSKPILIHTIERLNRFITNAEFIVALPESQFEYWKELCKKYHLSIPHKLSKGGETRFESVKNALTFVKEESVVAIHDGVRPLVSETVVKRCMSTAEMEGSAIPTLNLLESLRQLNGDTSSVVNRSNYKIVQTPQCFKSDTILKAYKLEYNESFTDDASVAEALGENVVLVDGNKENIKITTPEDMKIAEMYLKSDD
jgi:2-C-methyl-D-erythritol 4-phosphate cytidylyltransferase